MLRVVTETSSQHAAPCASADYTVRILTKQQLPMPAVRTATFTESVIREMTRVAMEAKAINLAQGFPDFPMPQAMKAAACDAITRDINQYAVTWGAPPLRKAIAAKYQQMYGFEFEHDRELTVTCGATEAMASVFLALIDPDDEVIVFEPWYENYGPDAILAGAKPVFVPLEPPEWKFDPERLRRAFTSRTRAIIVNTPHNPTGHVFTRAELQLIADLCIEHDVWAFTDEIYEHIRYAGEHLLLATFPGMRERTVKISGLSKTFSCTGWRLGYAIAPPDETNAIRKVHDFLTVGAPARCRRPVPWGSPSPRTITAVCRESMPSGATRCAPPCSAPDFASRCRRGRTTCWPTSLRSATRTTANSRCGWRARSVSPPFRGPRSTRQAAASA
jgi:histidinol-phosphate/aromatic aminotransferase/cobyric acid decarboxylase-like protein